MDMQLWFALKQKDDLYFLGLCIFDVHYYKQMLLQRRMMHIYCPSLYEWGTFHVNALRHVWPGPCPLLPLIVQRQVAGS